MTATFSFLHQKDAHALAPLIAAYAQALKRGAPRRPDDYYAELLTADRTAEIIGGFIGEELVGFAVFFDLPDMISGLRTGQIDDIYVLPAHRGRGIGRGLIEVLMREGQKRGWARLRWIIPKPVDTAASGERGAGHLYEDLAKPSEARLYEIRIASSQ